MIVKIKQVEGLQTVLNLKVSGAGSGTTNYLTKWSSSTGIVDSQLRDDGTSVGIGVAPSAFDQVLIDSNALSNGLKVQNNNSGYAIRTITDGANSTTANVSIEGIAKGATGTTANAVNIAGLFLGGSTVPVDVTTAIAETFGAVIRAHESTKKAIGLYIDSTTSNTLDNIGLYVSTANVGTGNNYSIIVPSGAGNVGLGVSVPTAQLHVVGNFRLVNGAQTIDYVLRSDANGNSSWVDVNSLPINVPAWTSVLTSGNISGGVSPNLSDGDTLRAVSGNSYLDLRYGADSISRLESTDGVHIFAGPGNGYRGLFVDSIGRTIVGGTAALSTASGLSVYQDMSTNKDIFSKNGVFYMYGAAANARGWLVVDTVLSRFKVGAAFSGGVAVTVGAAQEMHTDFHYTAIGAQGHLYGRIVEIGAMQAQTAGDGSYASTLRLSPSHNDGTDTITKSSNFRTVFYDTILRNIATYLDVDSINVFKAYNTGVLETNTIQMTNDSRIQAVNGDSYIDPRYLSTDSNLRIHAEENMLISTGFRKTIVIGADTNSGVSDVPPTFTNNSTYQQVQIYGLNIRGNFSIGTGLASTGSIIGIGTEYAQVRWGNFFIDHNNTTYGSTSFRSTSKFSFLDVYGEEMMSISNNAFSKILELPTTEPSTSVAATTLRSGVLIMNQRYWSKAVSDLTGVDTQRVLTLDTKRESYDGGVNFEGIAVLDYNGVDSIKINEDGRVTLDKLTINAYTVATVPTVWNNGVIIVTNENGGRTIATGDASSGTWKRVSDGSNISI